MVGGPQGAAIGAGVGFLAGGIMGSEQADSQRRARIDAQKKAEYARRRQVMKELGAKQQADQLAVASSKPSSSGSAPANAAALSTQGTIGASIPPSNTPSIAGTF
jgi:hypothetical protein